MKRKGVIVLIILMVIGFATVTTTLVLNGVVGIAFNKKDFNVIFTSAKLNNVERNDFIDSETKKTLTFETDTLITVGEESVLYYEVTNTSSMYDADVEIIYNMVDEEDNIIESNEYITIECQPESMRVSAGKTESGSITVRLKKALTEDHIVRIRSNLSARPMERSSLAADISRNEDNYLYHSKIIIGEMPIDSRDSLWKDVPLYKIESITILTTKEVPTNAIEAWDVSNNHNGSIMAYTLDEDDNDMYELYVGQDGGVVANPDSSYLFSGGDDQHVDVAWMSGFGNLKEINGLENLDTSRVTNMSGMFFGCRNLTNLDLSSFNTEKVTSMNNMFGECRNLATLNVSSFNTSNVTDMSYMFAIAGWEHPYEYMMLERIIGLENFDTSNVIDMRGMFENCSNLLSINLSSFNTTNVTDMSDMFSNCRSLTTLDVSNFDTSNVTKMDYMFDNCRGLISLDLSNFDTSNITTMYALFYNCSSLTSLNVANFDTSNVTSMYDMFFNCKNLISLDLSSWDISNVTTTYGMFYNCSKLTTTITIRGTNCTSYERPWGGAYGMFEEAATEEGSIIMVNYTSDAYELVDNMIATKSSGSNVVKGELVY